MQNQEELNRNKSEQKTKLGRFGECAILYIIEAALEYFVALSVADTYLAKITKAVGMSDSTTAVLAAFVSLGCSFQFISTLIIRTRRVKKIVTAGHFLSQTLFTSAYLLPLAAFSGELKCTLLVIALLGAQILHNMVVAHKINWYMGMIRDENRGVFTSLKEIISLLGGMIFTQALAASFDLFEASGNETAAFVFGAIILAVITLSHTVTLIFTKEKEPEDFSAEKSVPFLESIKSLFKNKDMLKIIFTFSLWYAANYAVLSFSGTYRNEELGFSQTFSTTIATVCSLIRAAISIPMGKFADKKGFNKLLSLCFAAGALGFGIYAFTVPANGKFLFPIFYMLYNIVGAGASMASINLIYDYIPSEHCTQAFALTNSVAGIVGFLTMLALTPIMNAVQANGNIVFGTTIYSQQIFAIFSCLIAAFLSFFTLKCFGKRKNAKE